MSYSNRADEIALIDLFLGLLKRWKFIALTGLIGLASAFLMVVEKEPQYKISISLAPPTNSDIQSFVTTSSLLQQPVVWAGSPSPWTPYVPPPSKIDAAAVYHAFEYNLISDVMQSRYLQQHENVPMLEFTKSGRTITIFAYSKDPDRELNLIHGYVAYASKQTIDIFAKHLADDITNRIIVGRYAENSLVRIFLREQFDRIAILEEALEIAKNAGVVVRLEKTYSSINNTPLYFRGTKFLQAEIDALQQRGKPDAYLHVSQLREIQEWVRMLGDIKIDTTKIKIAIPGSPEIVEIRRDIARTLALGLLGGILLSIAIIFFTMLLKQRTES